MGDIHGNYHGLVECLNKCEFDYENDTLIQLGDVADRGRHTFECIEKLLTIKNLIPIIGNHDRWVYEYFHEDKSPNFWLEQGGRETLESYDRMIIKQKDVGQLVKFFESQVPYYIDNENRLFVHAGYTSMDGVENEPEEKTFYWERKFWINAFKIEELENGAEKERQSKIYNQYKEVFIGHTKTTHLKAELNVRESNDPNQRLNKPVVVPMKRLNVYNLDTGSSKDSFGRLTIMDVETKEYWQSNS